MQSAPRTALSLRLSGKNKRVRTQTPRDEDILDMGELRQRPVKGAPVRLRKRRKILTSDEKIAMLAEYSALTKEEADGRMLPGASKRLTEEYGVSRSYVTQRLLPQAKDSTRKNRFHKLA